MEYVFKSNPPNIVLIGLYTEFHVCQLLSGEEKYGCIPGNVYFDSWWGVTEQWMMYLFWSLRGFNTSGDFLWWCYFIFMAFSTLACLTHVEESFIAFVSADHIRKLSNWDITWQIPVNTQGHAITQPEHHAMVAGDGAGQGDWLACHHHQVCRLLGEHSRAPWKGKNWLV